MDAIERAIRSAFEKGDAEDRGFRERVYRKAFAALDRGIMASKGLTVEAAMNQRKALQAKIAEIESEFIPAVAADDEPVLEAGEPMVAAPMAPEPMVATPAPGEPIVAAQMAPEPPPLAEAEPAEAGLADPVFAEPTFGDAAPPVGTAPALDPDPSFAPTQEAFRPGLAPAPEIGYSATADAGHAAAPSIDIRASRDPIVSGEPTFDTPTLLEIEAVGLDPRAQGAGHVEPDGTLAPEAALASAVRVEAADTRARRRRRPLMIGFIAATLVALVAIGGWWASETGLFLSQAERDTSVPNPSPVAEPEDFIPEDEEPPVLSSAPDPQRDWIFIFSPSDASNLTAPADATAEAMQDESGTFLRVRSGASGSAVIFDVGRGVLDQLAGKVATFDIVARGAEGKQTQMAVFCNFGELGDCGRKRYAVGFERSDYLFEITFPDKPAGAGGTIAINSDFANTGNAVDIYEIKVSVAR